MLLWILISVRFSSRALRSRDGFFTDDLHGGSRRGAIIHGWLPPGEGHDFRLAFAFAAAPGGHLLW